MPYYNRDPNRDHNFDNHPYRSLNQVPEQQPSLRDHHSPHCGIPSGDPSLPCLKRRKAHHPNYLQSTTFTTSYLVGRTCRTPQAVGALGYTFTTLSPVVARAPNPHGIPGACCWLRQHAAPRGSRREQRMCFVPF